MAREFVASRVWRVPNDGGLLASRRPLLNSFVPNLVWLPNQIAKLTDLEGRDVQQALQAMSFARYREAKVSPHLREVVDHAWSLLPPPVAKPSASMNDWNYFVPTDRFLKLRQERIVSVHPALATLLAGGQLTSKVIATRYTEGLPSVDYDALERLERDLSRFIFR